MVYHQKQQVQVAVKVFTKNFSINRLELIKEAGQFNSVNEAANKFVNSCTEATEQHNAII